MGTTELKRRIIKLLKEDEEFRYMVAGLIGLEEILKKLDRNEAELVRLREEMKKLREDMIAGFRRHDEILKQHSEELVRLRQEMAEGFRRHDEILKQHSEELVRLRQEMAEGFRRHEVELVRLREDMKRGFELVNRHISALGARWGLMAEEAFREGLRGVLEKELGLKVERWTAYDERGRVYGYPSEVEVDVVVRDNKVMLIEISSHVRASDVSHFKRKAELYEEKTGRKPSRLMIVTPFIEEKAVEASKELGIEVYTKI